MDLSALLSPRTTLGQFVTSSHREYDAIQHNPPVDVLFHARRHCNDLREGYLDLVGPSTVSSGWRCEALNARVGGSVAPLSAHCYGLASDETPQVMHIVDAFNRVVKAGLPIDKAILETKAGTTWIHLQSPHPGLQPRRLFLMYWPDDGYLKYNPNYQRVLDLRK